MSVKKIKGGYAVVHCHGPDKGKRIGPVYKTKAEAERQHRAIQARKNARKK
jgi:hypothetical protein